MASCGAVVGLSAVTPQASAPAEAAHRPLARARSLLFVPGHQPDRWAKALASGADAVVLDLEDAVPLADKDRARSALLRAWAGWDATTRARLLVRINPPGTPWFEADVAALVALPGLAAVILPKAESAATVARLVALGPPVLPLVESAEGLAQLDALARAPGVLRLALGHIDLQADLGLACGPDEAELAPARWALVLASRRAGLPAPLDGVSTATRDLGSVAHDTQRARRHGFTGKLCIHPAQVPVVHAALAPTASQLDWARRVLAAQALAGGGACQVDGKMVDAPVVLLAQQLLADGPATPTPTP